MGDTNDMVDLEEELYQHFVRKKTNEPNSVSKTPACKIQDSIPLLLCDIHDMNPLKVHGFVSYAFGETIAFRLCLVYGHIVGLVGGNSWANHYTLDDGTATMSLFHPKNDEDKAAVAKMHSEFNIWRKMYTMYAMQSKDKVLNCLEHLLMQTQKNMDDKLAIGDKVLVLGKPRYFHGKWSIRGHKLYKDKQMKRDLEIAFKDYLIDWYVEKDDKTTVADPV